MTVPHGFALDALDALYARVLAAARALDPGFPALGAYVDTGLDTAGNPGEQIRSYRGEQGAHAIAMWVVEDVTDGVGGPRGVPNHAGFVVAGLPAGCELRGRWSGSEHTDTVIAGPPARVDEAHRALRGG